MDQVNQIWCLRARPNQPQQCQEVTEADLTVAAIERAEVISNITCASNRAAGAGADETEHGEKVVEVHHPVWFATHTGNVPNATRLRQAT